MSFKVKIIKGQEIKSRPFTAGGKDLVSTSFGVMFVDGDKKDEVDPKAQCLGDRVEFLKAAQASGEELEVLETKTNSAGYTSYKFAALGSKPQGQGGFRPFTPGPSRKFAGQKVSKDEFVAITDELLFNFAGSLMKSVFGAEVSTSQLSPETQNVLIQEARSLVAQFWMGYEAEVVTLAKNSSDGAKTEGATKGS